MLVVGKGEVKFGCNLVTCHSEERSDEESAFVRRTKKQIPLPPRRSKLWSAVRMRDRIDRPGGTFMSIGGPKAHVTLGMEWSGLFSSACQ
jgi:hypothetical protein